MSIAERPDSAKRRRGVSKRTRFEVLKRDKFTCQYCGASVADATELQVDHRVPVAEGGSDDFSNLITACRACNSGKGAIPLDDDTLQRQHEKILADAQRATAEAERSADRWVDLREEVERYWDRRTGCTLTETGHRKLERWLRQYGHAMVIRGMDRALEWSMSKTWDTALDEAEHAYGKIPSAIKWEQREDAGEGYVNEHLYTLGILNNRLKFVDKPWCMEVMQRVHGVIPHDEVREIALRAEDDDDFCDAVLELHASYLARECGNG